MVHLQLIKKIYVILLDVILHEHQKYILSSINKILYRTAFRNFFLLLYCKRKLLYLAKCRFSCVVDWQHFGNIRIVIRLPIFMTIRILWILKRLRMRLLLWNYVGQVAFNKFSVYKIIMQQDCLSIFKLFLWYTYVTNQLDRFRVQMCKIFTDLYVKKIGSGSGKMMHNRPVADPDPQHCRQCEVIASFFSPFHLI